MNCPVCQEKLVRTKYAGANVRECPTCHRLLVASSRAKKIERRIDKDIETLEKEVVTSSGIDTNEAIRCPDCRVKMKKVLIKKLGFNVDECKQCGMTLFDAGELASMQLAFENHPQTAELNKMRDRLNNMTDQERKEYEQRIAKLTDLGTPMAQAFRGATLEMVDQYYWRSNR